MDWYNIITAVVAIGALGASFYAIHLSRNANKISNKSNDIASEALQRTNIDYIQKIAPTITMKYMSSEVIPLEQAPVIIIKNSAIGTAKITKIDTERHIKLLPSIAIEDDSKIEFPIIIQKNEKVFNLKVLSDRFYAKYHRQWETESPTEKRMHLHSTWFSVDYFDEIGTPYNVSLSFDSTTGIFEGEPVIRRLPKSV